MRFLSYANDLYHFGTTLCLKKNAPTFVCGETAEKRHCSASRHERPSFSTLARRQTYLILVAASKLSIATMVSSDRTGRPRLIFVVRINKMCMFIVNKVIGLTTKTSSGPQIGLNHIHTQMLQLLQATRHLAPQAR